MWRVLRRGKDRNGHDRIEVDRGGSGRRGREMM